MMPMEEFFAGLDAAVVGLLEPRDEAGHPDLPGYRPEMGPRYGYPGHSDPLSVFRGEGKVLFSLARVLKPAAIADCYTGTGYAAMCLAAGAPEAEVYSVDTFEEGDVGDLGPRTVAELRNRLQLWNLRLFRGSGAEAIRQALNGRPVQLVLRDPYYADIPFVCGQTVCVFHDSARMGGALQFLVLGGSYMVVACLTPEILRTTQAVVTALFPTQSYQEYQDAQTRGR